MQANKLVAFKDVKSNNVDAICNPWGEVYFYFAEGTMDCLVTRMHRSTKGMTLQISGWKTGGDTLGVKCTHHDDVYAALQHIVDTVNKLA